MFLLLIAREAGAADSRRGSREVASMDTDAAANVPIVNAVRGMIGMERGTITSNL